MGKNRRLKGDYYCDKKCSLINPSYTWITSLGVVKKDSYRYDKATASREICVKRKKEIDHPK